MAIAYVLLFFGAAVLTMALTPIIRRWAIVAGAVDAPCARKVHSAPMPRWGGVAIGIAFVCTLAVGLLTLEGYRWNVVFGIVLGAVLMVIVGAIDDRYDLAPRWKLLGQTAAAAVVVACGVKVEWINLPFGYDATLSWLSIPVTIAWIVLVTNAINLIDGLDGLAAGVCAIATGTILVLAVIMGNVTVVLLSVVLLGTILGFLIFNFHPAKIFMGDSGALFLGFCLASLSVLGFKQATLVSFVVPLFILGVPLSDTFFAIVRRLYHKQPLTAADKNHLHHCLLALGLSHRNTVLVIYGVALAFALSAVLMSTAAQWVAVIVVVVTLLALQIGAELIGIVSNRARPIMQFVRWFLHIK
jgi:UDP-GlcNAc:undecaprenyl-phosphate GlcNAc-1-phosphate transferase